MPLKHPIVVASPGFDENSGGVIVLHRLVDQLRKLGHDAYLFPLRSDFSRGMKHLVTGLANGRGAADHFGYVARGIRNRFPALQRLLVPPPPSWDVPVAPSSILRRSVVVYPEGVSGNPLGGAHVVRWLLNKNGFSKAKVPFAANELTFYYLPAFLEGSENVDPDNVLRVRWLRHDIYQDRGLGERDGACRLIRKGAFTGVGARPADDDAILIDGMSHREMADVFNRTKILYCHDPYTMYAYYAAVCGCIPVVLPQPGLSREQWLASTIVKHGVAYGEDDIERAAESRSLLISDMKQAEASDVATVVAFVRKLRDNFE